MTWSSILGELAENRAQPSQAALDQLQDAPRVFVAGAGRSGLAMQAFAMRLMQLGKTAYVVGETTTPAIAAGDLLIIGSSSGSSARLVTMAQTARDMGATVWLWTTQADSPVGQLAQETVTLAGRDKFTTGTASQQVLGSLFEQSLWLYGDLLTAVYMETAAITADTLKARHANLD
ncbi:SIS domain-containing protein [Leuconostocaceae bacterium ESL0958]|nr:SIS domain-containing protein [Leuconostocaceae bacterium ESL0958]